MRLSKRCEEALTDERLIEMHDEIALVDARLGDVLGRVDKGKSGRWIKEARDAWRRFERAEKAGDEGEVEGARAEVDRLLRGATLDYAAWSEVYTLLEQRRKLAESERKRIEEMHNSVASQQAMAFVGSLE